MPFKAFLTPPELHSRIADRKLSPLLSPLQDSLADKTLLEPREIARPKKVCFSESNLPTGDRSRRTYYLNGMVHTGGPGWGKPCSGDLAEASFPSGDEQGGKPGRARDQAYVCLSWTLGKKWSCLSLYLVAKSVYAILDISPFWGGGVASQPACSPLFTGSFGEGGNY